MVQTSQTIWPDQVPKNVKGVLSVKWRMWCVGGLLVLLMMGGLYHSQMTPESTRWVNTQWDRVLRALHLPQPARPTPAQAATTKGATPIFKIIRGESLARTYYYRFDQNLPTDGRDVFETAVATFNQTGLVHLKPGVGPDGSNQVVFSAYRQTAKDPQKIELGHGGPEIVNTLNPRGMLTSNQATASLNQAYPQAFNDAVATHELGHALGLEHSRDIDSVMYPTNQGNTDLTTGDLAGLRGIYGSRPRVAHP